MMNKYFAFIIETVETTTGGSDPKISLAVLIQLLNDREAESIGIVRVIAVRFEVTRFRRILV